MKAIKFVLPLLLLLALAGIGYADAFLNPTSGQTKSGSFVINISSTVNPNVTANCSVTMTSANAGSTFRVVARNNSGALGQYQNATFQTTQMNDASDWVFAGTCYNTSMATVATLTSVTGVIINNTVPILSVSAPTAAASITDNTQTWTATGNNVTSATLTYNGLSYTMAESGNINATTFTYTLNTLKGGTYTWSVAATDGLDTTTSTSTLKVSVSRNRQLSGTQDTSVPTTQPSGGLFGMSMTTVIIIGVVLYFVFNKSGGKSKRKR